MRNNLIDRLRGAVKFNAIVDIAIVAGVVAFVLQNWIDDNRARIETATEMAIKFNGADFNPFKDTLRATLTTPELRDLSESGMSTSEYDRYITQSVDLDMGLQNALVNVLDYFRVVSVCVRVGRCDRDTTISLFSPFAIELACAYAPAIKFLASERGYTDAAAGLSELGAASASCN